MVHNYPSAPNILCINEWVGIPGQRETPIDEIAAKYFPHRAIDYMSTDIDGLDYRILETMTLRPKVIGIEGGFAFHPLFTQRVPDEVAARNISQPLAVLIDMAERPDTRPSASIRMYFWYLTSWPRHSAGSKRTP